MRKFACHTIIMRQHEPSCSADCESCLIDSVIYLNPFGYLVASTTEVGLSLIKQLLKVMIILRDPFKKRNCEHALKLSPG